MPEQRYIAPTNGSSLTAIPVFEARSAYLDNQADVRLSVTDGAGNVYSCQPGQAYRVSLRPSVAFTVQFDRPITFGQGIVTFSSYDAADAVTPGGAGTSGRGNWYDRISREVRLNGDEPINQSGGTVILNSYTVALTKNAYIASIYLRLYQLVGSVNRRHNQLTAYIFNVGDSTDVKIAEALALKSMMCAPYIGPYYNIVEERTDCGHMREGARLDVRSTNDGIHNNFRGEYQVRLLEYDA